MIVIGADTHKRTHTVAAAFAGNGQLAGELTISAREVGFAQVLAWAHDLDRERIWAIAIQDLSLTLVLPVDVLTRPGLCTFL